MDVQTNSHEMSIQIRRSYFIKTVGGKRVDKSFDGRWTSLTLDISSTMAPPLMLRKSVEILGTLQLMFSRLHYTGSPSQQALLCDLKEGWFYPARLCRQKAKPVKPLSSLCIMTTTEILLIYFFTFIILVIIF